MDKDIMAHMCVCGKKLKSGRGMKIHCTKMGCLGSLSSQEQLSDVSDKTLFMYVYVLVKKSKNTKPLC